MTVINNTNEEIEIQFYILDNDGRYISRTFKKNNKESAKALANWLSLEIEFTIKYKVDCFKSLANKLIYGDTIENNY